MTRHLQRKRPQYSTEALRGSREPATQIRMVANTKPIATKVVAPVVANSTIRTLVLLRRGDYPAAPKWRSSRVSQLH